MKDLQLNAEHLVLRLIAGGRDENDILSLIEIAKQKVIEGWSNSDIIEYMYYSPHYENWNSEYTLKKMKEIEERYK